MKINKIISFALGLALLPMLSSCDSDEPIVQTPLTSPSVSVTSTFNSVVCAWDAIDGATSYGYEWMDGDGNLITRSVTSEPTLSFTGLPNSTSYHLNVWAYGAYGSANGTSNVASYDIRTLDLTPLGTPVVSVKEGKNYRFTFSWDAVDNASTYTYTLYKPDGSIQATSVYTRTSVSLTLSAIGTYTFTIKSDADKDALALGYCDSELATVTVTRE